MEHKKMKIDELIISHIPVLLWKRILLFDYIEKPQKFKHLETKIYNTTIVKTHYKKIAS